MIIAVRQQLHRSIHNHKEVKTLSKCPQCGTEIDHLRYFDLHWSEQRFEVTTDNIPIYTSDQVTMYDPIEMEYNCPVCDKTLFKVESEAVAFLKGGK